MPEARAYLINRKDVGIAHYGRDWLGRQSTLGLAVVGPYPSRAMPHRVTIYAGGPCYAPDNPGSVWMLVSMRQE